EGVEVAKVRLDSVKRPVTLDNTATAFEALDVLWLNERNFDITISYSDAEFLKRVLNDVRGNAPTALELKYFTEDKDPKKREKLLDTLLKDPAAQKKLGDSWKAKMLAQKPAQLQTGPWTTDRLFFYVEPQNNGYLELFNTKPNTLEYFVQPLPPTPPVPPKPPAPP